MNHLDPHNLEWARQMVKDYYHLTYGRNTSSCPLNRHRCARDAANWLAKEDWHQCNVNESAALRQR